MDKDLLIEKSKERYGKLIEKFSFNSKKVHYGIGEVKVDLGHQNTLCMDDTGKVAVYHKEQLIVQRYCFFEDDYIATINAILK